MSLIFKNITWKVKQENIPDWRPQNGFSQTSLALQEHDHATGASLPLETHLSQVTHIPWKIIIQYSHEEEKGQQKTITKGQSII